MKRAAPAKQRASPDPRSRESDLLGLGGSITNLAQLGGDLPATLSMAFGCNKSQIPVSFNPCEWLRVRSSSSQRCGLDSSRESRENPRQ